MNNFVYYAPTQVIFGKNAEAELGNLVKDLNCKKILIHYGGRSAEKTGVLNKVAKAVEDAGIAYVKLGGVVPNPHLSLVYEGIELCKKEGVDFILAVGGGSVIDSAKAIGYGAANEGDVWELYNGKRKPDACLPIGVVLTIAAAGSEMSNSSVLTKEDEGLKLSCNTNLARPKFAVMNPEFTLTLPDYQTSCGCTDIFLHTAERYFTSNGNMSITDSIAEALMRTVIKFAKVLRKQPDNYEARAEVMWAGSLSHNGLTGCGNKRNDMATHMMEHEVGGMFDVAHGAGLAALWGSWARYVYKDCLGRFVKFAVEVMGIEDGEDKEAVALKGIEAVEEFYRYMGMPTSLKELGISPTEEQIKKMAHLCSLACGGTNGSAKALNEEDMVKIYHMAM